MLGEGPWVEITNRKKKGQQASNLVYWWRDDIMGVASNRWMQVPSPIMLSCGLLPADYDDNDDTEIKWVCKLMFIHQDLQIKPVFKLSYKV